jgi:hypothetical protein
MGVPAGRQLDGAAGREAGTDERVESGLTTFLTQTPPTETLSNDPKYFGEVPKGNVMYRLDRQTHPA